MNKDERIFSTMGNNKGLPCPFLPIPFPCQEGYCQQCQIYIDWQKGEQWFCKGREDNAVVPEKEKGKMPDCEFLATCPFFSDSADEMAEGYKEQYCKKEFAWCGRYMIFKTLEPELKRMASSDLHRSPA